jgi:Uma2 family endonuclease
MPQALRETIPRMTVEEFLDWDGGGHQGKMELVNGIVVAMAPASATHGVIQGNIVRAIGNHIQRQGMPCLVGVEQPVLPLVAKGKNVRVPDVAVTCHKPSAIKTMPDPIMIAEVLSPSNERETWAAIQAVAGLPTMQEILVVDSTAVLVEAYRRLPDGSWQEEPSAVVRDVTGIVRIACLDFDLPLAEIYWQTYLAADAGP